MQARSNLRGFVASRASAAIVVAWFAGAGCADEDPACFEGEYRRCACADGALGYQRCAGAAYGSCDCGGTTPGIEGGAGGAAALFEPCIESSGCASELCFEYGVGPHCTESCAADEDCPEPSQGCSGVGVCRLP